MMMAKILIVLCFIAISSLDAFSRDRMGTARIIGGSDAPEGLYPYQVSVQVKNRHNCGGSILSKDYILTAAHCMVEYNLKDVTAVVGITKLSDGGSTHAVLEAHVHEEWDSNKVKNDIAVIKVEEITFSSKITPIPMDPEQLFHDLPCTVSGWGMTSFPGPIVIPNHLQHLNVTTISFEKCKSMNTIEVDIQKEICTLSKIGKGTCRSDSGGPLVRNVGGVRKQIGIVSWGEGCASGYPDVYVRVSTYIEWIKEKCDYCI